MPSGDHISAIRFAFLKRQIAFYTEGGNENGLQTSKVRRPLYIVIKKLNTYNQCASIAAFTAAAASSAFFFFGFTKKIKGKMAMKKSEIKRYVSR